MHPSYFITGSGTDIGKTYAMVTLLKILQTHHAIIGIKPLLSGFDPDNNDALEICKAIKNPALSVEEICPFTFKAALSPPMAAKLEGKHIDWNKVVEFCQIKMQQSSCLIEGAGGVLSPLTESYTNRDLIKALDVTAILVIGSYLGSINHSLTAYESLIDHGVKVSGIILSESENSVDFQETYHTVQMHINEHPIIPLKRNHTISFEAAHTLCPILDAKITIT